VDEVQVFKLSLDAGETGLGAVFYNGLEFLATACFTFICGPLLRNRMLIAIIADYAYPPRARRKAKPIDGGPLLVRETRAQGSAATVGPEFGISCLLSKPTRVGRDWVDLGTS
jgi:hypothetical protein